MTNNNVNLFVGDPDQEPSERALILRLRHDLERLGIPATFYANFFTVPRQRQIDLLVRVPWRTAHVEIKSLDPTLPVIAWPNGPWRRRLPDGTERATGGNYGSIKLTHYRQVYLVFFLKSGQRLRYSGSQWLPTRIAEARQRCDALTEQIRSLSYWQRIRADASHSSRRGMARVGASPA